jgi:hypothetical protein
VALPGSRRTDEPAKELAMTGPADEPLPLLARWIPPIVENARVTQQRIDAAVAGRFRDAHERRVAGAILAVTADPGLLEVLRFSADAVAAGVAALRAGAPVVIDDSPIAQALDQPQLERLRCTVHCGVRACRGPSKGCAGSSTTSTAPSSPSDTIRRRCCSSWTASTRPWRDRP